MGPMPMAPAGIDPQALLMSGVGQGGPMAGPGPQIPQQIMPQQGGGMGGAMQDPRIAAIVRALMAGGGGGMPAGMSGAMPRMG